MISSYKALMDLARSAPGMLYASVGIGLTGRKGGRFAQITESIAEVSFELIDEAVSVGLEADSSCLILCHLMSCKTFFCWEGTSIHM